MPNRHPRIPPSVSSRLPRYSLGRLTKIQSDQGTVEYHYDAAGRKTRRILNGTETTDYTWDDAHRLTDIQHGALHVHYSYDAANRLTDKTLPNGSRQTYTWDAANRLSQLTTTDPSGRVTQNLVYAYDASGQRTEIQGQASTPETPFTAQYDQGNRLTTLTLKGETWDLAYTPSGRLESRTRRGDGAQTRYRWDARGQLSGIDGPNGTAAYRYDALGRRTEKTINGQTTNYLYDGQQAVAELQGGALGTIHLTGLGLDEALARISGVAWMEPKAESGDDGSAPCPNRSGFHCITSGLHLLRARPRRPFFLG